MNIQILGRAEWKIGSGKESNSWKRNITPLNEVFSMVRSEAAQRIVMMKKPVLENSALAIPKTNPIAEKQEGRKFNEKTIIGATIATNHDTLKRHAKSFRDSPLFLGKMVERKKNLAIKWTRLLPWRQKERTVPQAVKSLVEQSPQLFQRLEQSPTLKPLFLKAWVFFQIVILTPGWLIQGLLTIWLDLLVSSQNYTPCARNKKVTTAYGNDFPFSGQGLIPLTDSIFLKSASNVPKLICNIRFITKLTKHLDCSITFFPSHCVIQDKTWKMIGHAKENGDGNFAAMLCSSALQEMDMILQHNGLGHPSFTIMQKIFTSFDFNKISFHCEVCKMAKHYHATFQSTNEKSVVPFNLIHTGVQGKSRIPNASGASWFVTFIDDGHMGVFAQKQIQS